MSEIRPIKNNKCVLSVLRYSLHHFRGKGQNQHVLQIEVRLPVLLCAAKTVEGDFRFCWMISPNVGQTHKENPNLVRIFI